MEQEQQSRTEAIITVIVSSTDHYCRRIATRIYASWVWWPERALF